MTVSRALYADDPVGWLLEAIPESDEEAVDLAGACKGVESQLADRRRMLLSEVAGDVTGEHWSLEQRRSAKRTYNDDRILSDLLSATDTDSLLDLLLMLRDRDVVRFQWQWSKLARLFQDLGVDLHVAAGEVGAGDAAQVGEVWSTQSTLKPVTE